MFQIKLIHASIGDSKGVSVPLRGNMFQIIDVETEPIRRRLGMFPSPYGAICFKWLLLLFFVHLARMFPSPYGAICFKWRKIAADQRSSLKFPSPYGAICFKLNVIEFFKIVPTKFPSPYGAICFKSKYRG